MAEVDVLRRWESGDHVHVQSTGSTYNLGHILELYNVLVEIRLTTNKMKRAIQYSKLSIRVASRVAKRLKNQNLRKQGNIRNIPNLGGDIAQRPVSLPEILNLGISSPKAGKSRYQTFLDLSSFTGFLYFVPNILSSIVIMDLHIDI